MSTNESEGWCPVSTCTPGKEDVLVLTCTYIYSILFSFFCKFAELLVGPLSLSDKALSLHLLFLSVGCLFSSSSHEYKAVIVETFIILQLNSVSLNHTLTRIYSHLFTSKYLARHTHTDKKKNAVLRYDFTFDIGKESHMKALWHTINALKVYWHASVPVRSYLRSSIEETEEPCFHWYAAFWFT